MLVFIFLKKKGFGLGFASDMKTNIIVAIKQCAIPLAIVMLVFLYAFVWHNDFQDGDCKDDYECIYDNKVIYILTAVYACITICWFIIDHWVFSS